MPFRILVAGAGKSGTTGLFECLRNTARAQFGSTVRGLFEPREPGRLERFDPEYGVVKILLERLRWMELRDGFLKEHFQRRVFIVRDPRDVIVSRVMWTIGTRLHATGEREQSFIMQLLAAKQRHPESVSTLQICEALHSIRPDYAKMAKTLGYLPATEAHLWQGIFFRLAYEDFVDGRLDGLSDFLGLPVAPVHESNPNFAHIKRTASHGNWKHWFLAEDYDYFVDPPLLQNLGYEAARYTGAKAISFEDTVGYVERLAPQRLILRT